MELLIGNKLYDKCIHFWKNTLKFVVKIANTEEFSELVDIISSEVQDVQENFDKTYRVLLKVRVFKLVR